MLLQGSIFSVPIGIEKDELHSYYEEWIRPFFSIIYNNPEFKFFIYISGIVFEYLEKYAKESLDLLKEFSDRKQIEILHGMYYDAASALQPKSEQKAQLERLSHYISSNNINKVSSKGAWLTPGTYDQNIIGSIKDHGMEFLIADGAYLEPSLPSHNIGVVDLLGKRLFILPYDDVVDFTYDNALSVEDITNILSSDKEDAYKIIFTIRSATTDFNLFFKNYRDFLQELKRQELYRYSILPTEYIKRETTSKKVCRIRTSPFGVDEYKSFCNFLTSRYESRLLYSYFLYILKKISSHKNIKDKDRKLTARMQLNQLQNHFIYWKYDSDWGIHNNSLRQYAYQSLGNIQENFEKKPNLSLLTTDFNLDGINEIILESNNMTTVLEPQFGSVVLLQKRQKKNKRWNYAASYIPTVNPLYIPSSFREMLVPSDKDIVDLHNNIINHHYTYSLVNYENFSGNSARASVIYETTTRKPMRLEKRYSFFRNNNFNIGYRLNNSMESLFENEIHSLDITLIIEINLVLTRTSLDEMEIMVDQSLIKSYECMAEKVQELSLSCFDVQEKITIQCSQEKFGVSIMPVIGSDGINEKNSYQYHSILLYQPISISSGNYEDRTFQISFANNKKK